MHARQICRVAATILAGIGSILASADETRPTPEPQDAYAPIQVSSAHAELAVTDDQQAWLNAHPVIRIAATPDWPPFEYVDPDGAYRGINADLLRLLCERLGLKTEIVTGDWPSLHRMLKQGELDVCPGMVATPERRASLLFTKPILSFPQAIYVREGDQHTKRMDDLLRKTVSIEKGYYIQDLLSDEYPDIELLPVDNSLQALLKVSNGEVDAYVGNTAVSSYLIDQNVIIGVKPIWCPELESLSLAIGVRQDSQALVDILNRAIDSLTARDKREVVERYTTVPHWVDLTDSEEAWIQAHPTIRLGIDPEFAPFEYVAQDGSYQGMASDYVRLLNQRLGLNMEVTHRDSWAEATALAGTHELDVLPCVSISDARREKFLFTDPYLSFYRVAITRDDGPLVTSLRDLSKLRVAVQANTSHHAFLTERTDISPVLYDTVEQTLAAVSRGEADAAVGNVATVSYWIRRLGLANLRVAAPVDEGANRLHFAVRKDWPELVSILNKGLASVTEEEARAIRQEWVEVSVHPGLDMGRVLRPVAAVVAVAAFVLGMLAYHNRRLRREMRVRRRAEDALRHSEQDYRTLVEGANSVILRMTPEGVVVFVNAFAERFFGYPSGEIVGKNVVGTIVPETETKGRDLRQLMEELGHNPSEYEVNENENITKSGDRVWVAWTNRPLYDEDGKLKEVLCVGADMTARKRAEEILLRYEFIVNTVNDMMSVLNADGRYEAVNSAWCSTMGMDREDVIGRSLAEVWTPKIAEAEIRPNLTACLSGELVQYESLLDLPGHGQRHCEVTVYPYADRTGTVTHAVIVTHDVTDWRTAQAALNEAKASAEAANRAKSAFLANMSHEIRTPMNAILGYTQLLRRQTGLATDQHHALEAIARSGDHLLALINDVLEMSKIEAGRVELHPATFDLRALLADVDVMFRVRANAKGIELVTTVDESVPYLIHADDGRVRQILINLLGNAIKFTDRGRVSLHTTYAEHSPENGGDLTIEVADTGCGIQSGELDSIFESFEQAGAAALRRGGTGLGLSISRNFARMMDGDITVTSEPGAGSRFRFVASVERGTEAEVAPQLPERHVKHLRPDQGEVRVLVVDDRATNRDLLCRLLEKVGFVTREAENGAEGLEALTEWRPQVVLIDLVMPVMDGREAIRRMRRMPEGEGVAIVAVTASTLDEAQAEVLAEGADAFLRKPFHDNELFDLIRAHAGVAYEYQDEKAFASTEQAGISLEEMARDLAACSQDVRNRLQQAIAMGSIDDAVDIANEVREHAPALATAIDTHAREFALHELDALFGEQGGVSHE